MLSNKHQRSSGKADTHHCWYCVSKRMTRGIAESLHVQITMARLAACKVGVCREKYHNSQKYAHPALSGATVRGVVRAPNAPYLAVLNCNRIRLRLQKTEHKQRGTSCLCTARRNGLPCTSDVLWTVKFWKLLNQNLTMQATESNERYPRSTIFNVLEGQTERFVANIVQILRNSPFSGKVYTTSRLFASVKLQQRTIFSIRPSIVHRTVRWYLGLFGSVDTGRYF